MKTTLTQAWEARGLAGMMLRGKVIYELIGRRYKENPGKVEAVKSGLVWLSMGIVALGAFLIFLNLVIHTSVGRSLDLSQTVIFLSLVAIFVGVFGLVFGTGYGFVQAYRCFVSVGLDDRYVFQHRDDEVEL